MSVVRRRRTPKNSEPVSARPRALSLMASILTGRGWLFDLYPIRRGMQVWFLREDGEPVALWERYAPSFYAEEPRSEEHTSELQSRSDLVCRLLLEKKKNTTTECNK